MRQSICIRRRPTWLACTALAALAPGVAVAQQEDENTDPDIEVAQTSTQAEPIIVTGSRLPVPDFDTPTPVISIGEDVLAQQGTTNLTEFLLQEPALVGSFDAVETGPISNNSFIGSTGLNLLNLRNLGVSRTLVLQNGRRHISQLPNDSAVDINTIPVDLVERIDVVTGGVSAVYGADAVSGVVNFVTDTDFEGLAARAQMGFGAGGEPFDYFGSVTGGLNFADGRGNVAGSFQYDHQGRLQTFDRDYAGPFASRLAFGRNRADEQAGDDPNVPDNILFDDLRFCDTAPNGGVFTSFTNDFVAPDFTGDGTPFQLGDAIVPPFFCSGGDGTLVSGYTGDLIGESDSYVGNLFVNFEFSPAAHLFGELKYARVEANAQGQPSFDFFLGVPTDNPFIPAPILADTFAFGLPFVSRDNFDLGRRSEDTTRETWRAVVGLRGELADWLNYDASYVYGRSEVENLAINNRFNDRWFAAIDVVTNPATGQPDCRINVDPTSIPFNASGEVLTAFQNGTTTFSPGECIPFNLFVDGAATNLLAADWIMQDTLSTARSEHHVATGYVYGDIPGISLPGGEISWLLGGEFRREEAQDDPNEFDRRGLTFGNVLQPEGGSFEVWEAFAELQLPILSGVPLADDLRLNLAARISDYTTIGSTFTWNAGLIWAPIPDIRFRGTYSQSVRAPNTGELFGAQSQDFEFIDDPCDVSNLDNGSEFRAANCAAILTGFGIDPTTFIDPNSATVAGRSGGNPNLTEETSEVWTAGVVFEPRFAPGLNLAIDFYDITIEDAVNFATAEEIAENCVDAPDLANVFCDNITRDPGTGGIVDFLQIPQNVAEFRTRGIDLNLNWTIDPFDYGIESDIGVFNIRLVGSYLDRLTFIPSPGAALNDDRNEINAPKWLATFDLTWNRGPLTINYGFNYFNGTLRDSNETIEGDPDFFPPEFIHLPSRHTHDIFASADLTDYLQFYGGINNVFNQRPAIGLTITPVSPVGRFAYVGLRVKLGS